MAACGTVPGCGADRVGLGYLFLSPALAWLAYVSLPVLLIWVAGAGVVLARDGRFLTAGS